jgi:hypothetical protein
MLAKRPRRRPAAAHGPTRMWGVTRMGVTVAVVRQMAAADASVGSGQSPLAASLAPRLLRELPRQEIHPGRLVRSRR